MSINELTLFVTVFLGSFPTVDANTSQLPNITLREDFVMFINSTANAKSLANIN